ncbi:hypothetical protein [Aquimarina sp. AU119]|uniref:hypothetical protein n=1 Tax=Aquimarina sp. AU119 TaxID=2108528 RepID=UPI000D69189B|nr:hypothetical protein [Aquimarina sp. AU119]
MKSIVVTTVFLLFTVISFAQKDKVIFIKEVPIKLKSASRYSFHIGYEAIKDCDIAIDFSGGPNKFWAGKTIPVKKGKGLTHIEVDMKNSPSPGNGYKISLAIRKRGGNWETTTAATSISNIEITKRSEEILDDASFSPLTPNIVSSRETFDFEIKYKASQERKIVVAIHNKGQWMGASKAILVQKGSGTKKIQVKMSPPPEGDKYKFTLYYGSGEGFPDKYIISKEITDIKITKAGKKVETTTAQTAIPQKTVKLSDLREQSIPLSINKNSDILTIPGDAPYSFIKIIAMNGSILKESQNTNSIQVSDLPKGGYFAITNKNDSYKFIKF